MRLALAVLLLAAPVPGHACRPRHQVGPKKIVRKADHVVRARVVGECRDGDAPCALTRAEGRGRMAGRLLMYTDMGPPRVAVQFEVVEDLTGKGAPDPLIIAGHLVDASDFNDGTVPYDLVRSAGRSGGCFAFDYRVGGEYLLFLRALGGQLDPYWAPLAPVNEEITGADDPWVAWVRGRL